MDRPASLLLPASLLPVSRAPTIASLKPRVLISIPLWRFMRRAALLLNRVWKFSKATPGFKDLSLLLYCQQPLFYVYIFSSDISVSLYKIKR